MTKTRRYLLAPAALVLCAAGWTGYAQRQAPPRPTWEYKTVRVMHAELFGSPSFSSQSVQGWELATAVYVPEERAAYYTFKRPR